MLLTATQLTALKNHLLANTNTVTTTDPSTPPFVVNSVLAGGDPTMQGFVANLFYNVGAKSTDNQPFANRKVWNPITTILQINAAMKWQTPPAGSTAADRSEMWLQWQSMIWSLGGGQIGIGIDFGDPQVRKGITTVFGDVVNGNAAALGGTGCGQKIGTNMELVLSDAVVGATTALTDAHPVQKDATGITIYGQLLTAADIAKALAN